MNYRLREAVVADAPQLLLLMRELAAFEGYLDNFAVTEHELEKRGFDHFGVRQFTALVAECEKRLIGYAVVYIVPFTYTLKPTLVLKELFVREVYRGHRIGLMFLSEVESCAIRLGCDCIRWSILPNNERAKQFYAGWGGEPDQQWHHWKKQL